MSKLIMWNLITLDGFSRAQKTGIWTGTSTSGVRNWSVLNRATAFC